MRARDGVRVAIFTLSFTLCATAERIPFRVPSQQSATQAHQQTLAGSASADTKDPLIQTMALRVAQSIRESKGKKVLVFDFVGPDITSAAGASGPAAKRVPKGEPSKTISRLGRSLAKEFDAALGQLLPNVDVTSWNQFYQKLTPDNFMPPLVRDLTTALWATNAARFDLLVWGDFKSAPPDKLELRLFCYRVRDEQAIEGLQVPILLTPYAKKLSGVIVKETWDANYPMGGQNGITSPRCEYCPRAQFPAGVVIKINKGTVVLEAIIATDGRAKTIKVVRGLPWGFTEKAVEAVQHWRLQPARGPDGKPTAVRQTIIVTFTSFF